MEGHLPPPLQPLLLRGALLVAEARRAHALSEKFADSARAVEVGQGRVSVGKASRAEGGEAELRQAAVEEHLRGDVHAGDSIL